MQAGGKYEEYRWSVQAKAMMVLHWKSFVEWDSMVGMD